METVTACFLGHLRVDGGLDRRRSSVAPSPLAPKSFTANPVRKPVAGALGQAWQRQPAEDQQRVEGSSWSTFPFVRPPSGDEPGLGPVARQEQHGGQAAVRQLVIGAQFQHLPPAGAEAS